MKTPILLIAVLGYTCASPNGYYHTEYNYKTSQSSFRNNELEHKSDDQGYYKKDGDLENRYKPIEDSNSEHSEYINPKFHNAQYGYDYNRDTNSYGHMRAGTYGSINNQEVEDMAHSNRIYGSQAGYTGSSYGSYGMTSNLRLVTSRLQQQLEREIQDMIRYNSLNSRMDLAELERELRQNLTNRLDNELNLKYGQQLIRSGKSYSMIGGRLQPTANYDYQELLDLRNQLENVLLSQLRTQYNQYNQYSYSNSNANNYAYTTTQRPYYTTVSYSPIYPTVSTPSYPTFSTPIYSTYSTPTYSTYSTYSTPRYYTHNQYNNIQTRYTPITNPESITSIASRVQSQLDANLNNILDETRRTHFSSSQQYSLTNPEVLLERLRTELRNNITYHLDDVIRQNYGSQTQRDGYMYSVSPSGALSSDYNYSLRDLENLKEQIERNLMNKLNRDFETFSKSWSSSASYRSQSSYGTNYGAGISNYRTGTGIGTYGTGTYGAGTYGSGTYGSGTYGTDTYGTTPTYYQPGIKTNEYGSSASAHNTYVSQSTGNMAELQRQLQADLSRQLNLAVNRESAGSYTYSPQNYQASLQELSNQLNRNLTRHLQEYSASGSYAAHGNFNSAQMADLRSRLEHNLMNQLREGLQQSMQTHSSYSSSSSSSSLGSYQNAYESSICCQGDDPTTYHRFKRSYEQFEQDLGGVGQQQIEETAWKPWERDSDHMSHHTPHSTYHMATYNTHQKPAYFDWRSRNHNNGSPHLSRSKLQVDQSQDELGQQQEEVEYVNIGSLHRQQQDIGQQQLENFVPQVQVNRLTHGKIISSADQEEQDLGQQQEDMGLDYIPQVNKYRTFTHGKISNADQELHNLGQQQEEDEFSYDPQVQVNRSHKLTHGKILGNPDEEQDDLGQQQEEVGLGYAPQIEENRYPNLGHGRISNADQEQDLGQQQEEVGLGYASQMEENRYPKPSHSRIISDADQEQQDLVQQEEIGLGYAPQIQVNKYPKLSHGKIISNTAQEQQDLGQQQEEEGLGYATQIQVNRYPKLSYDKIISNTAQEQQELGQQQEEVGLGYGPQIEENRYPKPSHNRIISNADQEQQDLGQQQEEIGLGYIPQLQVNKYPKPSHGKIISNTAQEQQDLSQQQEEVGLGYVPQIQVNRYPKLSLGKIISNTAQEQQELGQQQEEVGLGYAPQIEENRYPKFSHSRIISNADQEQQDLGQQQEEIGLGYAPQLQVNKYPKPSHGKIISNTAQEEQDLSQQQEEVGLGYVPQIQVNRYPKLSLGKIISNTAQEQDLGQQQEEVGLGYAPQIEENRYSKPSHSRISDADQKQQDLGQQQEEIGLGYVPQKPVNKYPKLSHGNIISNTAQEQQDLSQQQEEVGLGYAPQIEENRYPKLSHGRIIGNTAQEQEDLGQHQEEIGLGYAPQIQVNKYPKLSHGKIISNTAQEQQDLSQQQEEVGLGYAPQIEENRYPKLSHGRIIGNTAQEQEDLGQHQEEIGLGYAPQIQVNKYPKLSHGKISSNDDQEHQNLSQQQEVELGYYPQVQVNGYHTFTHGKISDANQEQQNLNEQQQVEDLGQQIEETSLHKIPVENLHHVGQQQPKANNVDIAKQVEEILLNSNNNHGILHNTDQQNLGQKFDDNNLDQQQVEEVGFHKVTQGKFQPMHQQEEDLGQQLEDVVHQQSSGWDVKPHITLEIQTKPIDIGQKHYINQDPELNEPGDGKIEQVPNSGLDLNQQVEEIDVKSAKKTNDLPDDISKKTEYIQEDLSKKLEIAIIAFCGTDKLNVVKMREKLTEEVKNNVTEEFNKESTRDYLEHDLHLSSAQILKIKTLILEKLFAKLEAGIEYAKRKYGEQTISFSDINEPEISNFTTEDTQQPESSTISQNGTMLIQTTRKHTIITSHTQIHNNKFGVTDQRQYISIPQTRVEAENEADSLISVLRNYIQKEVKRNEVPENVGVQTFVSNGTDDNGGNYYSRTTIYRGDSENVEPSFARTISTSSYLSGDRPFHDVQQEEIIARSILHKNPQTYSDELLNGNSIFPKQQHSHYGHFDLNSNISPHHHSIYSGEELNVPSSYNKKIQETSFSTPLEPHHNHGSYGQQQPKRDWKKISGGNFDHSFHFSQKDEIEYPKLTQGKVGFNFGQHHEIQQQIEDRNLPKFTDEKSPNADQKYRDLDQQPQEQIEDSLSTTTPKGKLHLNNQQNQQEIDDQDFDQVTDVIYNKRSQGKLEVSPVQHQQKIEQTEQIPEDLNPNNVHVDDEVKDPKKNVENLTFWQRFTQKMNNGANAIKQQATVLKQKAKELKEKVIG
ncbi:uncharacterized protein LOC130442855 isoform X2 [Diorhabda sublineata]|uniref:uncharacterized protein LOC130442855 isoform X2 n=1 Tax=Diorhabda sublineata TaxID=1163346 RepID=UPI0024E09E6D|nr:uncharacterized protein LOC130442855 isoform X2 [Diorhabda sublineata]